jgi:hypothetical protein
MVIRLKQDNSELLLYLTILIVETLEIYLNPKVGDRLCGHHPVLIYVNIHGDLFAQILQNHQVNEGIRSNHLSAPPPLARFASYLRGEAI